MFLNKTLIRKVHYIIIVNSLPTFYSVLKWYSRTWSKQTNKQTLFLGHIMLQVFRGYSIRKMLFLVIKFFYFILVGLLSAVVSQCPIWLFSEVPLRRAVQVYFSDYFLNDSEVAGIASIFATISTSITLVLIFQLRLGLYVLKYFRLLFWSDFYLLKLQCIVPGKFLFNYHAFWCLVHC